MVTQLNTYSEDIEDTPRLPYETLLEGGGDCEDLAILTASILKAVNPEWNVSLVYMDLDNPTDLKDLNHVTVYVETNEISTFVEPTSKTQMDPFGTVDGYYLEID